VTVVALVPYQTPCAKVQKLRIIDEHGHETWGDWCYKHHHWLNGDHGVTRGAIDELIESARPSQGEPDAR
jgi:hypothetical protein